jgi:hypothetical protein
MTGINLKDAEEVKKIDKKVEAKVKEIVDNLKHSQTKFEDPDFGPNEKDEYGAASLYGSAVPDPAAGSKYPAPNTLKWQRPSYDSETFVHTEEKGEGEEEGDEFDDDFGGSSGGDKGAEVGSR